MSKFQELQTVVEGAIEETSARAVIDQLLVLSCFVYLGEHECVDDSLIEDFQNLAEQAYRRTLEEMVKEARRRATKPEIG